jgi:hypothetical protein
MPILVIFAELKKQKGVVAQLARAFDWQSKGRGFDSHRLHKQKALNNFKATQNHHKTLIEKDFIRVFVFQKTPRIILNNQFSEKITRKFSPNHLKFFAFLLKFQNKFYNLSSIFSP